MPLPPARPGPPTPPMPVVVVGNATPPPILPAPGGVAAFVGYTAIGRAQQPVRLSGFADFTAQFGGLSADSVLSYAVRDFFAGGGQSAWVVRVPRQAPNVDGSPGGLPGVPELLGNATLKTGLHALDEIADINLLCLPDATRPAADDATRSDLPIAGAQATLWAGALAWCQARRAFLLIDPPPELGRSESAVDWVQTQLGAVAASPDAAAYFPRIMAQDPLQPGAQREAAPCGAVAAVFARTDAYQGVWRAPAGPSATLDGIGSLAQTVADGQAELLNQAALNALRSFPGTGPVVWGARTLAGKGTDAGPWTYIPARRLALMIETSLLRGLAWTAFEADDAQLWSAIRTRVDDFLNTLFRAGAFAGTTPAQAWFVRCDAGTTSAADIAAGRVRLVLGFAPLRPAEFTLLELTLAALPG